MSLGNMLKLLVYIVSAMSQLFILCWTGDKLIDLSSATANKVYLCNWHVTVGQLKSDRARQKDTSFLKNIMFVIQRSQKPICVTAMQFSILSLKSFAAVSVLRSGHNFNCIFKLDVGFSPQSRY